MDKVKLDLVGQDGNAYNLLGRFKVEARRQGWTLEEVSRVIEDATSEDYDHLLATLEGHCEDE